jgi:uncharacterized protein
MALFTGGNDTMTTPVLDRHPRMTLTLGGWAGDYLEAITKQWLLVAPRANPAMLEMFRDRDTPPYRQMVPWAGEFAGKYLTGAVQVLRVTGDPRLRAFLEDFVRRLIGLQAEDGYLGPWPKAHRLTNFDPLQTDGGMPTWDTWGHYHVMLGLLLWYDETGDETALDAAARIGDLLCNRYLGQPERRLVETGSTEMNLAPVHSLCLLYQRTGTQPYLDLALQIVDEFAAEGPEGPLAGDYLRQALAGREFFEMPKPRWESLHPIMALAELYHITEKAEYRQAFEHIWYSIAKHDRHNNGGFSSGEKASGNPYDRAPIETCCTIAWIALSVEMLRMTGESTIADEIELSTLNSVTGMHSSTGRWATYNTPMDGARRASAHSIVFQAREGSPELNCCSVNSSRGFGMLSDWAVMHDHSADAALPALVLNYYGPSVLKTRLGSGVGEQEPVAVTLTQKTDYPVSGRVAVRVDPAAPSAFALKLRIPAWSARTRVAVNGSAVSDVTPGRYLVLSRIWHPGDEVVLELDMSLRFWVGERECAGLTSIYRGPLLLAYDHRYNLTSAQDDAPQVRHYDEWKPENNELLPMPSLDAQELEGTPVAWHDWLPPLLLLEFEAEGGQPVRLCDFGSAGEVGTLYRSWLSVRHL